MKIVRLEDLKRWPAQRELTPEEEAEAYRLARESFTADDLQEYTELNLHEWPDFGEFIDEMEAIQKQRAERNQNL